MSEEPGPTRRKYLNRPVIIAIGAIAWTVMIGAAAARYMVAQGYVDQSALKQRAMQVSEFKHRVEDEERANREIMAQEGGSGGIISKRLGLQARQQRAENLLAPGDPAITMDSEALEKEVSDAAKKVDAIEWIKRMLPYFSEGGMAMLIGIGLGIVSRGVLKIAIVFALLLIGGMEWLAYQGVLEVNWGAMAGLVHQTILNATPNGDIGAIIQEKLPSLGALGGGYFMGVKG
ncbi:MAG: putative membrane protein (Fun14 family) [Bradymonadia bacterium]|jgi:uncharacterized membrane protein (Fun14 family)